MLRRDTENRLARDWPAWLHEEWYNRTQRRLLVEALLQGDGEGLRDYKFWVFGGRVQLVKVDTGRFTGHKRAFFDPLWRRVDMAMQTPPSGRARRGPMACPAGG